jgi:hypothetical protein
VQSCTLPPVTASTSSEVQFPKGTGLEEEEDRDSVLRVKHWASVGRVLEVSLDSSTDARPFTDKGGRLRLARIEDPTFNVSRSSVPSSTSLQGVSGEDLVDLRLNFNDSNRRSGFTL